MTRRAMLLSVSLATNAILIAAAWHHLRSTASPGPTTPSREISSTAPAPAADENAIPPDLWVKTVGPTDDEASLTGAENDAVLLAQLRAAGFPPEALRGIFRHRLDERFEAEEVALISTQPPATYWRLDRYGDYDTQEMRAARRALSQRKSAMMHDLLGDDAYGPLQRRIWARNYGITDPDRVLPLEAALNNFREMEAEARATPLAMLPEDREKLEAISEARAREIAAILTPEEQAAYEARSGPSAVQVQFRLQDFNASEAEYHALLELQTEFTEQWGNNPIGLTREQREARAEAEKQLQASIESALGPDRYTDYAARSDMTYLMVKRLTDHLGLPPENALTVAALQKSTREQQNQINRDRTLSLEAREARLIELQTQTRQAVATALTAEGAEVYADSFGQWINFIVPPKGGGD